MRLLNFTIIKLTICLTLGILIGYFINIPTTLSLSITAFFLGLTLISLIISRRQFLKNLWFGLFAFILITCIGVLITNFHNQKNFSNHYTNLQQTSNDSLKTITFKIKEVLNSGNYHDKYVVEILKINTQKVKGKALLNIEHDLTTINPKIDDIYITKTRFKNIDAPLNPYQFNYKAYLERQYIYKQLYCSKATLFNTNSKSKSLFGLASDLRNFIIYKLETYNLKPNELTIIKALFLGQRQDINKAIYTDYINSGAVHILAVSGLHIGIILFILSFLLKPLENIIHGKLIKTILLVLLLWSFAIITGLSASVTRAVTMFSILTIALNLKRPTNIYNTLAISIFILLLFKPMFLFDIGFQLSYMAVFSIVIFDPYLYNIWRPKNWFLDKYWHTLTVSLSAQIGILPISLYYFHQFPGLFFISNLVLVPLLGIILGFGILIIILAVTNTLPFTLAKYFGKTIELMNHFVNWVSRQDDYILKDIPFDGFYVFITYSLILFGSLLLIKKQTKDLKLILICIIIFQCVFIYKNFNGSKNEFIVFHKTRHSLIGENIKHKLICYSDFDSITVSKNNIIKDFSIGKQINIIEKKPFKSVYELNHKTLLVIDSLGIYNIKTFLPAYVLLRQSPKINLNRLIDSIHPKQIIADGSNYKSYVNDWKTICRKRKLPFHATNEKGAFIINY